MSRSKSLTKLMQIRNLLAPYAGEKLTNSQLIKFADFLIRSSDDNYDDGVYKEPQQPQNYYNKELDNVLGHRNFLLLRYEYIFAEVFEGECVASKNLIKFREYNLSVNEDLWSF